MESTNIKPGFTFSIFGNSTQQKCFLDAFSGFEAELESQGYEALSTKDANDRLNGREPYPKTWKTDGPTASIFGPPHFLQLLALIQEPATTATLEVLLGTLIHPALKRLGRMFHKKDEEEEQPPAPSMQLPFKICQSVGFSQEQVLVTVIADIQAPEDILIAQYLIPQGFSQAVAWLERNRVTHHYLTYFIRGQRLDATPTLSERPFDNDGRLT